MTATELAQRLKVTPMAISQYANGRTTPRPEVMQQICTHLNLPEIFFKRPIRPRRDDAQEVFWRSFSSASRAARTQSARKFRWLKSIVEYLAGYLEFPAVNVPWIESPDNPLQMTSDNVEASANEARRFWQLGDGPISDLLLLVENNGIIASRHAMWTDAIDGFSQWSDDDKFPYLVLASDKESAVRSRYDAGHELGHLLLHRKLANAAIRTPTVHKALESQAFRFSAAFLLPAEPFLTELWAPTLDAFRSLKDRWKVSIGVMIKRCEDLGLITEEQGRRMWINYNRRGWRTNEPLDDTLPVEKPRLLRRSLEMLITEGGKSRQEVLEDLGLAASDIEDLCGLPLGFFSDEYEPVLAMPKFRKTDGTPSQNTGTAQVIPFVRKN